MKIDAPSEGLQMRVAAEVRALGLVRRALDDMLARAGWGGDQAARVLVAVGEAIANAVEHGWVAGAQIEVSIAIAPAQARVRIRDEGRPGAAHPTSDPVAPPPTSARGRGRLIMARLADRVEVVPAGAGTEVTVGFARLSRASGTCSFQTSGALASHPVASASCDSGEGLPRAGTHVCKKQPERDTNLAM